MRTRSARGALALALLVSACRPGPRHDRVLVLGLDGVDPQTVDLLLSEGKLPHFARLRQQGAYGRLRSMKPLLSPVIWTTIATGKTPDRHGIGHFVAVNPKTGEELPVTSRMRRVKALWNVFSDQGRRVAVVGWWATWPAERVNGAMVSDHTCYHFLFPAGVTGGSDPGGRTYPAALEAEIAPLVRRPGDLTPEDLGRFVHVDPADLGRPFAFTDDLSQFRWALATAESYGAIGRKLWQDLRPDLEMVYIEGTDTTSHLFGHLFRAQGLSGELLEQQRRYGGAVEAMYTYADDLVGQYLDSMDSRTTLIVLSDHGFELGALPDDPSKTRDMRRVSERFHREEGILYLYGNHVRPGVRIDSPSILDVAPTLLALAGLAPARDLAGRALAGALDLPAGESPAPVASYEAPGAGEAAEVAGAPAVDTVADAALRQRLESLGYLSAGSPKGDRNLAAVAFEAGRFEEAARAYTALVRKEPDDAGLHTSLAGALGALGRLEEAQRELESSIKLDPLNPEAYHNRAVIRERRGDREAAIADYRLALRYAPQYEPSRRALARLGAPGGPAVGMSPEAVALAERASVSARQGDYAGAMKLLDRAEELAPSLALVQQYRANVAFLAGDRKRAIAALERALELEPGNELYRTNLARLRAAPTP